MTIRGAAETRRARLAISDLLCTISALAGLSTRECRWTRRRAARRGELNCGCSEPVGAGAEHIWPFIPSFDFAV